MPEVGLKTLLAGFLVSLMLPIVISFTIFAALPPEIFWSFFISMFMMVMIAAATNLMVSVVLPILQERSFPVKVFIYEQRHGTVFIKLDRAKRLALQDAGKYAYRIKGERATTKTFDYKHLYPAGVSGRGVILHLYKPQAGEYHPINFTEENGLKPIPENMRYFVGEQIRRNFERHYKKGGLEKYMPLAMVLSAGVIFALIIYTGFLKFNETLQIYQGITQSQAEILDKLAKLVGVAHQAGLTPSIPALPAGIPIPPVP